MDYVHYSSKCSSQNQLNLSGRIPPVKCTQEDGGHHFLREKPPICNWHKSCLDKSILIIGKHASRTKQWRQTKLQSRGAPWFPVKMIHPLVAHKRPRLESYITQVTGSAHRKIETNEQRRFRKLVRRLFLVNLPANFTLQIAYTCFLERFVGRGFSPTRSLRSKSIFQCMSV
jgi:hypothetical protein